MSSTLASTVPAILAYALSSVGMMVGNKVASNVLSDPETGHSLSGMLVLGQVLASIALLYFRRAEIDAKHLRMEYVWQWIPIIVAFTAMLFTSAKSFQYVSVTFIIVIRNVGIIASSILEYFVRGQPITVPTLLAELLIVIGIAMYAGESALRFKDVKLGLTFCLANVFSQTAYAMVVRYKMDHTFPKSMSSFTMSLYNNSLSLPWFLAAAISEVPLSRTVLPRVSPVGWCLVSATGLCGFMISTSGFRLQRSVSATSFLVVNNMCKVVNIILSVVFLGDAFPSQWSVAGLCVCILGGFWYSFEQNRIKEQRKTKGQ